MRTSIATLLIGAIAITIIAVLELAGPAVDFTGGESPRVEVCGVTIELPQGTQEDDIIIKR